MSSRSSTGCLQTHGRVNELPASQARDEEPWTVKDALVHVTYRKANMVRTIRKQRRPDDERGSPPDEVNRVVYLRWRSRSPCDVLAWHRQVPKDILAALNEDFKNGSMAGSEDPIGPTISRVIPCFIE